MTQTSHSISSAPAPRIPAIILVDHRTADWRLAALSLLDRLIIAVHRGGFGPISIVTREELPDLRRSQAWAIPWSVVLEPPKLDHPVLVATTQLLVQPADVRLFFDQPGRLMTSEGRVLPIGSFQRYDGSNSPAFDTLPSLRCVTEASAPIGDRTELRQAERRLWASLTSSSDGTVDRYFNRPCGRPLSKLLVSTPVSPNSVSIASILVGIAGAFLLAQGATLAAVWGAIVFQFSAILDCVDGDIARAVYKESAWGKWIDLVGDQVVHATIFVGIAVGVGRSGSTVPAFWLGLSAVAGGLIAFGVVLRGMRLAHADSTLRQFIDRITNRDFSVLVFALAVADRLEWFLWMAAIGSHVFWLAALWLQSRSERTAHRAA